MRLTKLAAAIAAVACGSMVPRASLAQVYPSKAVRVVTPWPTGGLTDVVGRIIFQKISETTGQQFIIDNRPGAAGTIGAELVAKSKPDGYTLMVHSTTHVGNPHIYKQLPYDTLKDFVGVGLLAAQTGLLVVHPSLPVKSVKELIAFARARPEQILYASSGSGSFSHLAIALLTSMTNTRMTHIPYKGGGPATTAIVSGEAQFLVGSPAAVLTQLEAKRLRLLAVSSDTRLLQHPDTPTVAEAGYPGYDVKSWYAYVAPAGTPPAVIARLSSEIGRALSASDVQDRLRDLGLEIAPGSPAELGAFIRSETEKWSRVIKAAKVPLIN